MFAYAISISAPHIYISAVPFSPGGSWISKQYVPRLPRTPRVCIPPKDWPQDVIQHGDYIEGIAISADGARIAGACHDSGIFIWDIRTGVLNSGLLKCGGSAWCVAFSPDGAQLGYAVGNGTIGVWEIESGNTRTIAESIFGPESYDAVYRITFSPDGRKLIAGCQDGTVRSWDMLDGDASGAGILYQSIIKSQFKCVAFLSDGTLVACGHTEQTIEVCQWDAATLQLTGQPLHIEAGSTINAAGISSDGRYVAAASGYDTVNLWGLPEGTPIGVPVNPSVRSRYVR